MLAAAEATVTSRHSLYGPPVENFQDTVDMFNVRFRNKLHTPLEAHEFADFMVLVKIARNITSVTADNYLDIAGYAGCGFECMPK